MHETPAELNRVQRLLDESAEAAGTHMRRIITNERQLGAEGQV